MKRKLYHGVRTNGSIKKSLIHIENGCLGAGKSNNKKIIWRKDNPKKDYFRIDRFKPYCKFCETKMCAAPESEYSNGRIYYQKEKKHRTKIKRLKRKLITKVTMSYYI